MPPTKTLIMHTVSGASSDEAAKTLQSELTTRLPELNIHLANTPPQTKDHMPSSEILIAGVLPSSYLEIATDLKWIQSTFAGVNRYDHEYFDEHDIAFTSASGVHAIPIAEHVFGVLLQFERKLKRAVQQQEKHVWERWQGGELHGQTIGIIGVGAIGTRIAELADAFQMEVLGIKKHPESYPAAVDDIYGPDGLYEVLEASDYVVISCPLTDETRELIGWDELSAMKSSGVLVNIARGEIVDESALERAIPWGIIGGAALDTVETEPLPADSPLWDLSNVLITPHVSGTTPKYMQRLADIFEENYRSLFADGNA